MAAGALSILVEIPAVLMSREPYSLSRQAISDLGMSTCGLVDSYDPTIAVCSPAHPLVNGGWIAGGLVIGVVALAMRRWFASTAIGWIAAVMLALGGLLQAGVGLVPLDRDLELHAILGMGGIVVQNVGLTTAGVALRRRTSTRTLGALTLGLGVLGLAATGLLLAPSSWALPFGLVERVAVYPFLIWLVVAGARLVFSRSKGPPPPRRMIPRCRTRHRAWQ